MIDLDQQGSNKIQITEHANVAPNKCANCSFSGREPGRFFIDFGVDLEFYGTIYLCTSCFAECANIIGWISPTEADRLKLRDAELTAEFQRLKEFENKYVSIASYFDDADRSGGNLPGFDGGTNFSPVLDSQVVLSEFSESGHVDSDTARLLGTSTKSANKRRPADVPESTIDESQRPLSL
jgi:hypothetical protein